MPSLSNTARCLLAGTAVAAVAPGCGAEAEQAGFRDLGGGGASSASSSSSGVSSSSSGNVGAGGSAAPLGPPYPIVLAHGFFGFEEFAGLDFVTYYYGVKEHLASRGETLVFTPAVDPFNSSAFRGSQLAQRIEGILASTGHAKVNIIGHSQGGLDARVVAHDRPGLVGAVVTLQTPHRGTPIADIALKILDDPTLSDILDFVVKLVGAPLYDQIGKQTSVALPLHEFSSDGIAAFNESYPDRPSVFYASIAGRSDHHDGGSACQVSAAPSFISTWNGTTDPIDPLFAIPEAVLDGGIGDPYANDGLVRVHDAKWGTFLGCLPADHMDMVGQLLGDDPGSGWDHLEFYEQLVKYLRDQGY